MSDATERPADRRAEPDPDAWGAACAEDLAAEKARRRAQYGPPPGSAAEELRKLAEAVTEKLAGIQLPGALAGKAAQGTVNHFIRRAKNAVEPVIERNSDVFDHLASAGSELLAAYRSAVEGSERRWTRQDSRAPEDTDPRGADGGTRTGSTPSGTTGPKDTPRDDEGPAGTERIDLD